jgi:antitoxin HicB
MTNTLDYYMTLKYPVEITEIEEDEGGGISACIPLLGRYSCVADGETVQEALENLKATKEDLIRDLLGRNVPIPEPQTLKQADFSGRLLVRMPNALHMQIAEKAESNGESLNKYIVRALSAEIDRGQTAELQRLLLGITTLVEALTAQVNTCQVTSNNVYVGTSDLLSRGLASNWTGFPNVAQADRPSRIQGRMGLFELFCQEISTKEDSPTGMAIYANR